MPLNEPDSDDLERLAAMVGPKGVIAAASADAAPYLTEPRDRWQGRAAIILRPASTAEVSAVIAHAARRRLAVVPRSGGTGLVGGQTLDHGPAPVLLSLDRMNAIRAMRPDDGVAIAEAGVILADLHSAARGVGRLFPLSLASEGTARIGGLLATNAGGVNVLRYGNARDLCLGIEAVMADGRVLAGLKALRKDNTGYDLRHLLIGSEGTLGVITAAVLKLYPGVGERVTAMLAVPDPAAAVALLRHLRATLGDAVSAFELIAGRGLDFVRQFYPDRADPLLGDPVWRVLVELGGPVESGLASRAEAVFAGAIEQGLADDGAIAQSEAQADAMWWWRETIPEANRRIGAVSSHDIAVPLGLIPRFIAEATADIAVIDLELRINCFGHVGDGNLHFNVYPPEGAARADYDGMRWAVKRAVHDRADALGGTFSAEHGIGRLKTGDLARYGDPVRLAAMRAIKAALDPERILNPGAVLPDPDQSEH